MTLRRRVIFSTLLLLTVQGVAALLTLLAWARVGDAVEREQEIARVREAVIRLGEATREQYVHETHTYIEGSASHLDHHAEVAASVRERLDAARGLPLDTETRLAVEAIADAIRASQEHFSALIVPKARSGQLDRVTAVWLHAQTEDRAAVVAARVSDALSMLDQKQAAERAAVATATAEAWWGVLALVGIALCLGGAVGLNLLRSVTQPLAALQATTRDIAAGRQAWASESGDEEFESLGRAFNQMVERVRRAEEQRVQSERLAALGEMSAAVAHELMSPLNVILAVPEVRALPPVREEAEHARRIVEGLLGFSRPLSEAPQEVVLGELVATIVARQVILAEQREVSVQLMQEQPVTLRIAPGVVRQVLDNLLRNAVEASPPGGAVEVEVRGAVIEVRDRGPGIPAALRARLYQPFTTTKPGGTGLGLAVSARFVRALGGTLSHLDRPGGGTVARWEVARWEAEDKAILSPKGKE